MNTQISQISRFSSPVATSVNLVPFNGLDEPFNFPLLDNTHLSAVKRKFADHNLPGIIVITTVDGKIYTL